MRNKRHTLSKTDNSILQSPFSETTWQIHIKNTCRREIWTEINEMGTASKVLLHVATVREIYSTDTSASF